MYITQGKDVYQYDLHGSEDLVSIRLVPEALKQDSEPPASPFPVAHLPHLLKSFASAFSPFPPGHTCPLSESSFRPIPNRKYFSRDIRHRCGLTSQTAYLCNSICYWAVRACITCIATARVSIARTNRSRVPSASQPVGYVMYFLDPR